jgi:hypothetical protein
MHMHVHDTHWMSERTPSYRPRQAQDRRSPSAAGAARRLITHGWLYVPAVSSPIGGGLIKLGHGSTFAAASVGLAPYVVCASLYAVFVVSYLAAVLRYLCADAAGQQAMERFITVSANAVVAILTLNASVLPAQTMQLSRPRRPVKSGK